MRAKTGVYVHSAVHDGDSFIGCILPVTPFLPCVKRLTAVLLTKVGVGSR
jgi:hypothetical protein